MDKPYNVFISWSGQRSWTVAAFLRKWLPSVIQAAKPWLSSKDIEKGSRNQDEIMKALQDTKCGITCLTPENLMEPWILFEAGALLKTIGERPRLCTYLLCGLKPQEVPPPLGWFQATEAAKEETRSLLRTINAAVSEDPIADENLDQVFNALWRELEATLNNLPPADQAAPPKRKMEDMVAEILEFTRVETDRRQADERERLTRYLWGGLGGATGPTGPTPLLTPTHGGLEPVARSILGGQMPAPQAGPQGPQGATRPSAPFGHHGPAGPGPPLTPTADKKPK